MNKKILISSCTGIAIGALAGWFIALLSAPTPGQVLRQRIESASVEFGSRVKTSATNNGRNLADSVITILRILTISIRDFADACVCLVNSVVCEKEDANQVTNGRTETLDSEITIDGKQIQNDDKGKLAAVRENEPVPARQLETTRP